MREHAAAVDHEVAQQFVFLRRQHDLLAVEVNLVAHQIHADAAVDEFGFTRLAYDATLRRLALMRAISTSALNGLMM